jgi:FMN phosphatase YigB (HAD superfamily)
MRASEIQPRKLVIFDIDDTLVHTQTKVHVVKDGRVVKSLNSHDFTHYKLQPDEQFDFENFRNAHDFFHNSKPIIPMMNQLKSDIATGNKVVMVTARADFDDRELFLDTFRKYGVDMSNVHVYRAGNMSNKIQTEEKKKIIIRELLNKGQYSKAIMYDDAEPNLESFVELKDEYPQTKFYAWHVSLQGEASEYHRTDEGLMSFLAKPAAKTVVKTPTSSLADIRAASQQAQDLLPPAHIRMYLYRIKDAKEKGIAPQFSASEYRELEQWVARQKSQGTLPENFADGRNPQDKGDSKRHGINTKASVSSLRKTAKQGGRKGQLAHWLANMKAGRAKK